MTTLVKDANGSNVTMGTTTVAGVEYPAGYDPTFGKQLVGTARDKFRDEFFTYDTTNNWETIATGSGHTVSVAGAANGARYLNIATGITASTETIIQSRSTFKLPTKVAFGLSMSQRIANQEVFVELVGVDAAGNVETDATFASANLNNASNAASLKFDGTTAANAIYITRGFATSELASASSAFTGSTTAATGTSPNFIPATLYELNGDMEEVVFSSRAIDSLAAVQASFKRTQNIPDPAKDYKLRIRVRNLAVAPASTTDVRIHFVRVLDSTRFTVDMARHMGRTSDIADSIPVAVTNTPPVTIGSGTVTTVTTLSTLTGGGAAEDAAAGTNPLTVGGVVRSTTAPITLIAGDAARLTMTPGAAAVTKPYSTDGADWQYASAAGGITTTTDVAVKAAAGASLRNFVTSIDYINTAAVATELQIKDGATVIWRGWAPASMTTPVSVNFPTPLRGTANTAVNVACSAAAAVYANVQGYASA